MARLPEQAPLELLHEAIRLMDAASDKPPAELTAAIDVAERDIVALRDVLIERVRHNNSDAASPLEKVNVALSLVVGLEYPTGGIERDLLDQARAVLQDVLDSGLH